MQESTSSGGGTLKHLEAKQRTLAGKANSDRKSLLKWFVKPFGCKISRKDKTNLPQEEYALLTSNPIQAKDR